MSNAGAEDPFYYAQNRKISLVTAPEFLAVDIEEVSDSALAKAIEKEGRHLRRNYFLIRKDEFSKAQIEILSDGPASRTVFRQQNNLVIVLPEIRMHENRPDVRSNLDSWLSDQDERGEIIKAVGDRITLRPKSQSSIETLSLAAKIRDKLGVQIVEPRMLQLTEVAPESNQ